MNIRLFPFAAGLLDENSAIRFNPGPFIVGIVLALAPSVATAQPVLQASYLLGGPGDQHAFGIHKDGQDIYLSGYQGFSTGLFLKIDATDGSIVWTSSLTEVMVPFAITGGGGMLYTAGSVFPTHCGAVDGVGGTEGKPLLAVLFESTGATSSCSSFNVYGYKGYENYYSIVGGIGTYYAAGWAEESGSGGHRYLVGKYDVAGTKLSHVVDQQGYSFGFGIAEDSSGLYVSGFRRNSSWHGHPELPFLVKLDSTSLAELWRTDINAAAFGARAAFNEVVVSGNDVYAVGYWRDAGGNTDYLVARFVASTGALAWYNVFGSTPKYDQLIDVAVANGRLFAVGYSSTASGGGPPGDGVLIELNPSDGSPLNTTTFGGENDEVFYRMVAQGCGLYVAGYSNGYDTPEGNSIGQYDMVLQHYSVDTTAPTLGVSLTPALLWPPSHKLANVTANITASDDCGGSPTVELVSITSNEPDNGLGDGDTAGDIQGTTFGTDDRSFSLRAERAGGGAGRVYTVTYRATDSSGNTTETTAAVIVPHSMKK